MTRRWESISTSSNTASLGLLRWRIISVIRNQPWTSSQILCGKGDTSRRVFEAIHTTMKRIYRSSNRFSRRRFSRSDHFFRKWFQYFKRKIEMSFLNPRFIFLMEWRTAGKPISNFSSLNKFSMSSEPMLISWRHSDQTLWSNLFESVWDGGSSVIRSEQREQSSSTSRDLIMNRYETWRFLILHSEQSDRALSSTMRQFSSSTWNEYIQEFVSRIENSRRRWRQSSGFAEELISINVLCSLYCIRSRDFGETFSLYLWGWDPRKVVFLIFCSYSEIFLSFHRMIFSILVKGYTRIEKKSRK